MWKKIIIYDTIVTSSMISSLLKAPTVAHIIWQTSYYTITSYAHDLESVAHCMLILRISALSNTPKQRSYSNIFFDTDFDHGGALGAEHSTYFILRHCYSCQKHPREAVLQYGMDNFREILRDVTYVHTCQWDKNGHIAQPKMFLCNLFTTFPIGKYYASCRLRCYPIPSDVTLEAHATSLNCGSSLDIHFFRIRSWPRE